MFLDKVYRSAGCRPPSPRFRLRPVQLQRMSDTAVHYIFQIVHRMVRLETRAVVARQLQGCRTRLREVRLRRSDLCYKAPFIRLTILLA
jgi:hypothetical protein